jgi:hypothetical protein
MLRRTVLFGAGLTVLLAAALAGSASAATSGPAYFLKARGGMFTAPLHADGLTVYSASPAYLVLQAAPAGGATSLIKADAATHNYPWVAVATTIRGRTGMQCFSNAHLVTTTSRIDAFSENHIAYDGMFLQYLSRHFAAGAKRPTDCAPARGGLTGAPSVAVGKTSASLHIDCLVRRCSGTFVTYQPPRLCQSPNLLAPGHRGCPPLVKGRFVLGGGLSATFKVPLEGRSTSSILTAFTVNGRQSPVVALSRLPRLYQLPAKQRAATLSLTCPASGTTGSPVTVTGRLAPRGAPAPVALTFIGSSSTQSITASADASGAFAAPFTPSGGLLWVVDAVFAGDRTRVHAERACGFPLS